MELPVVIFTLIAEYLTITWIKVLRLVVRLPLPILVFGEVFVKNTLAIRVFNFMIFCTVRRGVYKLPKKNRANFLKLDAYSNCITNNNSLRGMTNLTYLKCSAEFTDEIANYLPNLTSLHCESNENLTDAALYALPNLTYLNCDSNENFTDSAIRSLTALTDLDLSNCESITDYALIGLNLKKLVCGSNTNITDASLKTLTGLTELCIGINPNFTVDSFRYLTALTALYMGKDNNITDDALQCCTNLRILFVCSNTTLTDLALKYCTNLQELHCGSANFTDAALNGLKLKGLYCGYNRCLTDASLSKQTELEYFDASFNYNFTDMGLQCPGLRTLHCGSSCFTRESLRRLTGLTTLGCGFYSKFTDDDIYNLVNLKKLECIHNYKITEHGINRLVKLKKLECCYRHISPDTPRPNLRIYYY